MDSQLDPPSPQGGAAVKRPPPGIAPPSGPAPPWVRTLAPEEARDSEGDDEIYEEDFEEEEVIATNVPAEAPGNVTSPTEPEEHSSPSLAVPKESLVQSKPQAASSPPVLEVTASPEGRPEKEARGAAESPGDPAFPQGLTKISAIKASVDLYATDSDDEEDSKQRFFSKLESIWRESHESQPLDYSALNKMLQSVETSIDGAKLQLSEREQEGFDSAGTSGLDLSQSRSISQAGAGKSDSDCDGERPSTPGRPPVGRTRPRTPAAVPSPNSKALKHSAGSSLGRADPSQPSSSTSSVQAASRGAADAETSEDPQQAPTNTGRAGRGKLQALKQKQAVRRKQPPSSRSTTSLSDFNPDLTVSLSASEQGSPKQKAPGNGRNLTEQFRELEQQMLSMSSQGELRSLKRHSEAQVKTLKSEVERLHVLLAEERLAKEAASAGLEELQRDSQQKQKQMRDGFESRLRERQKELTACKLRLQEVEKEGPKGKVLDEGATVVTLTAEELAELRQEIKEQEKLIAGYQQENEAAMRQIKELKSGENKKVESLSQEISRLESLLADHGEKEAAAAQDVGHKLREKLKLEVEVANVKQRAEEKELELRNEIDRLRKEKRDLDAKLGGVNLKQIAQDDELVKSIRVEMESLKQQHKMDVEEMKTKLAWYAENQEILTSNDELIRQQSETILELERRLKMYEGEDGKGTATVKKVKELQKQLQQLQDALVSKNPTSLPALVHAARPSLQETEQVQEMQAVIQRLHHQLRAKDDEMERKLRGLRQDHEKIRGQYETRKNAAAEKESRSDVRRIKEAEKQLSDVRSFYQKKVKALSEELQALRPKDSAARESGAQPPRKRHAPVEAAESDQDEEIARLSDQLRRREQRIVDLEAETSRLRMERGHADDRLESVVSERQHTEEAGVASLRKQVQELVLERDRLQEQLRGSAQQPTRSGTVTADRWAEAKAHSESAEMALAVVQRSHTAAVEKATRAEAAHQKAMQQLHEDHAARVHEVRAQAAREEAARWEARCFNAEKALAASERKVQSIQQELVSVEAGLHLNPSAAQFRRLEKKIAELEENETVKEKRWQSILEESQQVNVIQAAMERKKWEMLVQEKNMDIERFRLELDAILVAARDLALAQKHSPPVLAVQTRADFAKRPSQPLRALDPNSQDVPRL